MGLLDLKDFEELLSMQKDNIEQNEKSAPTSSENNKLLRYIEKKKLEELKREAESKYKPEDLPDDYFFSALGELILQ